MSKIFIQLIVIYQRIFSYNSYASCRHAPTCSSYSINVFKQYGAFMGIFFTINRLRKCFFYKKLSYDPIENIEKNIFYTFFKMFHVKQNNNRIVK